MEDSDIALISWTVSEFFPFFYSTQIDAYLVGHCVVLLQFFSPWDTNSLWIISGFDALRDPSSDFFIVRPTCWSTRCLGVRLSHKMGVGPSGPARPCIPSCLPMLGCPHYHRLALVLLWCPREHCPFYICFACSWDHRRRILGFAKIMAPREWWSQEGSQGSVSRSEFYPRLPEVLREPRVSRLPALLQESRRCRAPFGRCTSLWLFRTRRAPRVPSSRPKSRPSGRAMSPTPSLRPARPAWGVV